MEKEYLDLNVLRMTKAPGGVEVVGAAQNVGVVLHRVRLPWASMAGTASPMDAGIGTIVVEAAVGSAEGEDHEDMGGVDSCGIAGGGAAEEACRASHVVFAHCGEEQPVGRGISEGDGCS